jgi:hypothetical protein
MDNNAKFKAFLESLKTDETKGLIEAVTEGFDSLFEGSGREVFSQEEISSMGEKTLKVFVSRSKVGYGKTEEEAAKQLVAKFGVEPYGIVKTANGFIAFYNGEEAE